MKPNGLNAARRIRGSTVARSVLITFAIAAITLAAIAMPAAAAADGGATGQRTIEVSGNGEVQAAPDFAVLSLAIETHAATAATAAGRNAALAQKVGAALKAKLGDHGKTSTGGYSLYPEYSDDNRPNAKPTVTGYQAANTITVETASLDLVGPLIDAAIAAGANRINSLDFSLRNDAAQRNEAIAKAAKDAQGQAQALADALGVKLGPIVAATTASEPRPAPMMARMATMSLGASTPVQAGDVTVPATVSLTYQIE
jgi:uncharacterized protein